MNISKTQQFIERLSSDTLKGAIEWERSTPYAGIDPDSPSGKVAIFFSNEYRKVNYYDSFTGRLPSSAFVYLVDATTLSGRDGTMIHGLEFYIEDSIDHPHQLYVDQALLYQLRNSVNSYMAKKEAPLEGLINDYLNS